MWVVGWFRLYMFHCIDSFVSSPVLHGHTVLRSCTWEDIDQSSTPLPAAAGEVRSIQSGPFGHLLPGCLLNCILGKKI
jgi:hypothetical protein